MKSKLTQGVDYYVEDGRVVMTESFLRRRGHCCNSGCRHCPYDEKYKQSKTNN